MLASWSRTRCRSITTLLLLAPTAVLSQWSYSDEALKERHHHINSAHLHNTSLEILQYEQGAAAVGASSATDAAEPRVVEPTATGAAAGAGAEEIESSFSPKRCTNECYKHGTCNEEEGRCDCPAFYVGEDCSELGTPACQLTPEYKLPCQIGVPHGILPCACLAQCTQLYTNLTNGWWADYQDLADECIDSGEDASAYLTDPMSMRQRSWQSGRFKVDALLGEVTGPEHIRWRPLLPLGDCPDSCSYHGWCFPGKKESPQCQCFYGYGGDSCEAEVETWCPGGCSGRGACRQGFCFCQPGYYGPDCGLTFDPTTGKSRAWWHKAAAEVMRPAVYVYDMPSRFTSWHVHMAGNVNADFGRNIPFAFYDRLLASPYRTGDPDAADYFYWPCHGGPNSHRFNCFMFLREHWPYWNASSAPNHMWFAAHDIGANAYLFPTGATPLLLPDVGPGAELLTQEFLSRSVCLQHHGAHRGAPGWDKLGTFNPQADLPVPGFSAELITAVHPAPSPYLDRKLKAMGRETARKTKRVTLPDWNGMWPPFERRHTFFFSGSVEHYHNMEHGERELVESVAGGWPEFVWADELGPSPSRDDFVFVNSKNKTVARKAEMGRDQQAYMLATSTFCLAAHGKGGGYGVRFSLAVLSGCIPVLLNDNWTQWLGNVLPLEKFTVAIAERDVAQLEATLRGIRADTAKVQAMQAELECVWRMYLWSSIYGAYGDEDGIVDAFSTVMESLYRRMRPELSLKLDTACVELHQHQIDYYKRVHGGDADVATMKAFFTAVPAYDSERVKAKCSTYVTSSACPGHVTWRPGGAVCSAVNGTRPCM